MPNSILLSPRDLAIAAKAEKARREKARRHYLDFCRYVSPHFQTRPHRELIASALEQAQARRFRRLMIFCPPQYGKSELVSRMLPAWWLGKSPDDHIIMTSHTASLAFGFSRHNRNLLTTAPFQTVFGTMATIDEEEEPVELAPDSRAVQKWSLAHHRGGLLAAGVGGPITGNPAHLALIDDPLKGADWARSEVIKEAQREWFRADLSTRLDPNAVVVICMTRWAVDDLAGWLLSRQADGGQLWHVLRLPAAAETPAEMREWCERNFISPDRYLVGLHDAAGPLRAEPWATAGSLTA